MCAGVGWYKYQRSLALLGAGGGGLEGFVGALHSAPQTPESQAAILNQNTDQLQRLSPAGNILDILSDSHRTHR